MTWVAMSLGGDGFQGFEFCAECKHPSNLGPLVALCPCLQLFLGDTNRTISETPMNQASSRSHCIFTIYVEARKVGAQIVCYGKCGRAQ